MIGEIKIVINKNEKRFTINEDEIVYSLIFELDDLMVLILNHKD